MAYKPYYKKRPWEADERTMAYHNHLLGEIVRGRYADDAVYDLRTMHKEDFTNGYQVTFIHDGASYTPKEYASVMNEFLRYAVGHWTHVSQFNGYPEISFRIPNIRDAYRLARKYQQTSIFDWSTYEDVKVPERRIRNGRVQV